MMPSNTSSMMTSIIGVSPSATLPPGTTYENFDPAWCNYSICDLSVWGQLLYIPTLAGNVLYLCIFFVFLLAQAALGLGISLWPLNRRFFRVSHSRTYGYLAAMLSGITLEIIGYVGRILLHYDDFIFNYWLLYLICITIGPAFFSAAIYLCLARIMAIYGLNLFPKWLTQKRLTIFFMSADFFALLLQATGGALAATASGNILLGNIGRWIMVGGLSSQVASMLLFVATSGILALYVRRAKNRLNEHGAAVRESDVFKRLLWSLGLATVAIIIRCAFRVAELSHGFYSGLANNEIAFMILDGAMMIFTVALLTVSHPGPVFDHWWAQGNFKLRKKSKKASRKSMEKAGIIQGSSERILGAR